MQHQVFTRGEPAAEALTMPVALGRLQGAKRGYATRRIDLSLAGGLIVGEARPRAGDLVLAEVAGLGQHRRLEDADRAPGCALRG